MKSNHNTKDYQIQLSILNEDGVVVKTTIISLDDYIDETTGKKCQNVADDILTQMLKNVYKEVNQKFGT